MTYIFLVAGKGSRLHPLTYNYPKSLYRLDDDTTVIQRMVNLLRSYDKDAEIVAVTGFMASKIEENMPDITYIRNPFYGVTNSLASLWFAKEYLLKGDVVIINGDVVVSNEIADKILTKPVSGAVVLADSSIRTDGDYNVQVHNDRVVVMSKDIKSYFGEYAGITMLDREAAEHLYEETVLMNDDGCYECWYEDALVQMIFRKNFKLGYLDICNYDWTEIDCANDLVKAQEIHKGKM